MNQFRQVVKKYQDQVYSFSRHFLGDGEDAADVTQQVMIKLWQNYDKLQHEQLGGWVMRVTRNVCIDTYRQKKTRAAIREDEKSTDSFYGKSHSDADISLGRREMREKIDAAMRTLQEPQKTIVILREIQGLSYDEISEALELPLNTVKVYLHRGRQTMRQALTKSLELA